jgi:hypothetical protein
MLLQSPTLGRKGVSQGEGLPGKKSLWMTTYLYHHRENVQRRPLPKKTTSKEF